MHVNDSCVLGIDITPIAHATWSIKQRTYSRIPLPAGGNSLALIRYDDSETGPKNAVYLLLDDVVYQDTFNEKPNYTY